MPILYIIPLIYLSIPAHSTEHGNVLPMFAVEDALQGRGIDDDYSSGDKVRCWTPLRGDVVNAILEDGEAVSIGDFLESNGSGYLQKLVDTEGSTAASYDLIYSQPIVGIALENLDLSGSSGTGSTHESSVGTLGYNKRLQVKII